VNLPCTHDDGEAGLRTTTASTEKGSGRTQYRTQSESNNRSSEIIFVRRTDDVGGPLGEAGCSRCLSLAGRGPTRPSDRRQSCAFEKLDIKPWFKVYH